MGARTSDSGFQKKSVSGAIVSQANSDITAFVPASNLGADLGTASLQWGNLYVSTTTISGAASGTTKFGSCSTSHTLTASGDVIICGKQEVDGETWFDSASGVHLPKLTFSDQGDNDYLAMIDANQLGLYINSGQIGAITSASLLKINAVNSLTASGILSLYGGGTGGYTRIGSAATTGHGLAAANDLLIGGASEFDGTAWFDGASTFYGAITFSGSANGGIKQSADDGLMIAPATTDGQTNNNVIITNFANSGKDHDHDTPSLNPTLFIHSNLDPDTDNTQWISMAFVSSTDTGLIKSGSGAIGILSSTNTSTLRVGVTGLSAGCIAIQDNDKGGFTYCSTLDGTMTCGIASCE
uniref:Uncharacterized protein n=1 Tax=viral metagenome TaxID=1070528 RepID=A0A6H1ZL72_9ZZZZ